jgi:hypothetical protein
MGGLNIGSGDTTPAKEVEMSEANDDYRDVERVRNVQESEDAIDANHQTLVRLGIYNIVKVTAHQIDKVTGYITSITEVSGKTAKQIERALGLKAGQLASGAFIYRLDRIPTKKEFWPRGYNGLVDGKILKEHLTEDSAGYRRGQAVWQVTLKERVEIPAVLLAYIQGEQRFDPGVHPDTARHYPPDHPVHKKVRK